MKEGKKSYLCGRNALSLLCKVRGDSIFFYILNFTNNMAVRIRLQRHGRKQAPFYHIVVATAESPRDGRFIEKLGVYNPMTKPASIEIDRDRAFHWLSVGAEPTDTVRAILRFKGVLFRMHLARGVRKGAFSQEEADTKYAAWIETKEAEIASRRATTMKEVEDLHKKIFGVPAPPKVKEVPVAEVPASEESTTEEVAAEEPTSTEE